MKSEWSRWSCAARIVQVACAATAVVALAGLGVQPTDMKPVVASGVVLVDDEFDWAQQQEEDQDEQAQQDQDELQQQLAEQEMLQSEQEAQQAEQQAQLDVPGT